MMIETLDLNSFKSKVHDFENSKEWSFKGSRPAVLDFYAEWCGPCHALAPILEEIANEFLGQLDVYKVNTDRSPELASLFEVKGVPAILFIPIKGEPAMNSGFLTKEKFLKAIQDILELSPNLS